MKIKSAIFCLFVLTATLNQAFAQNAKKDTVYYLLDTVHTAPNDRMISIFKEGNHFLYSIKCPCLAYNNMPSFFSTVDRFSYIDKLIFKSIKFIQITHLIELVKKNDNILFNNKYSIFFVEPDGQKYIVRKLFYSPSRDPIDDRVTIHMDTSKKKKP